MDPPRQLVLPFPHEPDYRRCPFLEDDSNAPALAWLARTDAWPGGRLALWGGAGCGKSHLLARWADAKGGHHWRGPALRGWSRPPRADAMGRSGVAIDDADLAPEEPLLHLLNASAEAGCPALLAARAPPARWRVRLPDLTSRLRAITAVEIGPASDGLLRALLLRALGERQLAVPQPVQEWLLLRLPRTPEAMREAAARLDRLALASGGKITRATALGVLATLAEDAALQNDETCIGEDAAISCAGQPLL